MSKKTEALKLAQKAMGLIGADLVCEAAHHEKKDRHGIGDPCPIQARWHHTFDAIREALAEQCVCGEPDTPGTHRTDGPCLAEQPAPKDKQQEPVEYWTVADGWVSEQAEVPASAWIYPEFWDHCKIVGCGTAYRLPGDGRQPLYTTPPAAPASQEEIQRLSALVRAQQITIEKLESQRQWVGLTDEEIQKEFHPLHATGLQFARAIEAKLRKKNA